MKQIKYFPTFLRGACIGVASITPVSGSTIALILGIYNDLINILYGVSQIVKSFVMFIFGRHSFSIVRSHIQAVHWRFAWSIFFGVLITILLLANFLDWALYFYPQYMYGYFFGLVILSVPVPWQAIINPNRQHFFTMIITTLVVGALLLMAPTQILQSPSLGYLFLGGAIAISAMILPGISGSFVLIVMGLYNYIVGILRDLSNNQFESFLPLTVFLLGMIIGVLIFVRLIKRAMKFAPGYTMSFLSGLILASLPTVWPFFRVIDEQYLNVTITNFSIMEIFGLIIMVCLGMLTVIVLHRFAIKKNH